MLKTGDVGDFEPREHGIDYLDGMVFAPNQVYWVKSSNFVVENNSSFTMYSLIDSCWYCIDARTVGQNQGTA